MSHVFSHIHAFGLLAPACGLPEVGLILHDLAECPGQGGGKFPLSGGVHSSGPLSSL